MKVKGPIVTLVVGIAVGAGLLIANVVTSGGSTDVAAVGTIASATSSAAATQSGSPTATATTATATTATATATTAATAGATTATPTGQPSGSATGSAAAAVTTAYAGKVDRGGPLAISIKGSTAVAYLCDGKTEAWLWGTVDGNVLSLRNKNGATLNGTRGGGRVTGQLTAGGGHWTFSLPAVQKPSGLYRSTARIRGAKVVSGWVVLPNGTQVGMTTTNDTGAVSAPAIDLGTGKVIVQGTSLTASPLDPADGPA